MNEPRFTITSLDELERAGRGEWIPIRRRLGIRAFGVNAWSTEGEGEDMIGEHDELPTGHEELYVVVRGHAVLTVDGEEHDAPEGTILFVRDPAVRRAARSRAGGATIVTVGAKPEQPFRVSLWEESADIFPLFGEGRFAEAKERLEALVAEHPEAGGPLYNLACAEARLGEHEAALTHLARAVELEDRFAALARDDADFASIRDDPAFPGPP